jgi:YggT family protein
MNTLAAVLGVFTMAVQILIWIIIIQVVFSWLVAFNVINTHNDFVRTLLRGLDRLTEPMLRPIRRILPDLGGIDLSPMVLILALILVQRLVPALAFDIIGA